MHPRVKDVMTDPVATAMPGTTIGKVLKDMQVHRLNGTVIVDDERHVLGVVTQGDVFRAVLPTEAEVAADESYLLSADRLKEHITEALSRPVGAIMSSRVVSVSPEDPAVVAGGIMLEHRVKQLPVVEGGRLVGVVTIADITKQFL